MTEGLSIEGFAIVSRDGMLAGADGLMPNSLKFQPDLDFLDRSLDAAALLVHGRMSHEGQPNSPKRRRLLLSRAAGPFTTEPVEPNTWLWNPQATPFDDARRALGVTSGTVAILGGTSVYEMFLPLYSAFHLSRAGRVELPGGVPVFSAVRAGKPPEAVLLGQGLKLKTEAILDEREALRHQTWKRP